MVLVIFIFRYEFYVEGLNWEIVNIYEFDISDCFFFLFVLFNKFFNGIKYDFCVIVFWYVIGVRVYGW